MDTWRGRIARAAAAAALVAVAAAGVVFGRDGVVTLGLAATSFLVLLAALGALLYVAFRGDFPPRIGRGDVDLSAEDDEVTAASLGNIQATITETTEKLARVVDGLAEVTHRVEELERRTGR